MLNEFKVVQTCSMGIWQSVRLNFKKERETVVFPFDLFLCILICIVNSSARFGFALSVFISKHRGSFFLQFSVPIVRNCYFLSFLLFSIVTYIEWIINLSISRMIILPYFFSVWKPVCII